MSGTLISLEPVTGSRTITVIVKNKMKYNKYKNVRIFIAGEMMLINLIEKNENNH